MADFDKPEIPRGVSPERSKLAQDDKACRKE
jgi:hypothetical protein